MKILVSNKIDSPEIAVEHDEGKALAKKHNMEFFATSAKTGEGVEQMFKNTTSSVISQQMLAAERKE